MTNIQEQTDHKLTSINIINKEVTELLEEIDESKSPGPDNMHSNVIKELKSELLEPLTSTFTKSMEGSMLPQQ